VDDLSGLVYVGDLANRRIQVFDSQGAYVSQFTAPNVHDWQILGVSLGKDGNIYVADAFNNIIWGFATDGMLRYRIEVKR
jgi:DNA-binding beta-propeller fold protein YncE